MALTLIVTDAGRAALVNASNSGTAPVTIAQVGVSGAAVTPNRSATTLPGEIKRIATLSGDVVADDTIHLVVRDESNGVYTLRSFALYLADGTLFAIYGQTDVILEKSSQALMLMAIDVQFADINATRLTFGDANFLNPPATTERLGVVELATEAEARTGVDALRALTPAGAKAAILGWLLAQDGAGSGLDADLLDGRDGIWYADVPGRLGYTPANRAGDTFTGLVAARATGTAAGFSMVNARTGRDYRWIQKDNGWVHLTDESAGAERISVSDAGQVYINGALVWHIGNDGAGSGMDADLLDGQQGSFYADVPARLGYAPANKAGDTFTGLLTIYAGGLEAGARFLHQAVGRDWRMIAREDGTIAITDETARARRFAIDPTGAVFIGDAVAWHGGNDGAGSGLDADLLDGRDGSYYADVPGRLGYTPANRAGDTFTGLVTVRGSGSSAGLSMLNPAGGRDYRWIQKDSGWVHLTDETAGAERISVSPAGQVYTNGALVWHIGNDGAGSGLDADLLDGQDGSFYANVPARLGYTPANRSGDTFTGLVTIYAGGLAAGTRFLHQSTGRDWRMIAREDGSIAITDETASAARLTINPAGTVFMGQSLAWHAGNDGSGSGLDADLLDGFHADAFLRDLGHSFGENGYVILNNGLILQWGSVAGTWGANIDIPVSYPIAFPTATLGLVGSNSDVRAQKDAVVGFNYTPAPTPTGFNFRTNVAGQNRLNWFALGT